MITRSVHVLPLNDTMAHFVNPACPCYPLEIEKGLFVHNAEDCREAKERITGRTFRHPWEAVVLDTDPDGLEEPKE